MLECHVIHGEHGPRDTVKGKKVGGRIKQAISVKSIAYKPIASLGISRHQQPSFIMSRIS